MNFTLYQGTSSIRNNVRDLLCLLTRNNPDASEQLNSVLVNRVKKGMKEQSVNPSVVCLNKKNKTDTNRIKDRTPSLFSRMFVSLAAEMGFQQPITLVKS